MTACPRWREAALDHALGQPPGAALERHLAACPACSAALAAWREKSAQLDAAIQHLADVEPRPYGPERVLAEIAIRPCRPILGRMVLAGLIALACLVVALYRPRRPEPAVPPAVVALSAWRSPTQSLLRSSADPLIKGIPRLGETFFPTTSIGDKNAQ